MREMHARVPGSKLVELDAAHVSNLERPAAFTAALRDFLREHPR
jgi:3-oxoadipate enol-lactonase